MGLLAPPRRQAHDSPHRPAVGRPSAAVARIEQACERVLVFERVSYKSVERILRLGLDKTPALRTSSEGVKAIEHEQVRGADYFADEEEEEDQDAA